jgi:hypothetical protein
MRCMPTASAMVMATGSPSGTIDTIWLIATMKISPKGMPRINPRRARAQTARWRRHQPLAELVQPKFQRRPGILGRGGELRDLADLGLQSGGDDDRASASRREMRAGVDHVFAIAEPRLPAMRLYVSKPAGIHP